MVAMFVTLDIIEIRKFGLNLNEYLTLLKFQHDIEGKTFPFEPDERFFPRLLEDGFIIPKEDGIGYTLGSRGNEVFGGEDLFEEFFKLFPSSVETGIGRRVISAKDPNSISGKVTHEIWKRVTKNKPYLQRKIIDALKRELEHKRASNSLAYLQGIDTWLRQATWEKWEDIPDSEKSSSSSIKL